MKNDYYSLQWYKDAIFPFIMTISVVVVFPSIFAQQTLAAHVFRDQVWFLWSWMALLFFSNLITFVGVMLRRFNKGAWIWFEYPGSIMAAAALWVYSGTLLIANPGPAALAIAVTLVIGLHFFINFLIIHKSLMSR